MEQSSRQRYIVAIERLLRRGMEIPIDRRSIAEMIVDQVVDAAVEEERDTWVRLSFTPRTERSQ